MSDNAVWCKQCKTNKSPGQFLWGGKKGKIRVTICNPCAHVNMSRWARTHMVGKKADQFSDAED